jgi:hypothetical protein
MASLVAVLVLMASLPGRSLLAQSPAPDQELVRGIGQVNEGDFETAVVTLEAVARRLTGQPDRSRDLAQASLHLGIAYLALNRVEEARARFRDALAGDPQMRLSPQRFSPKVINAFEEVRKAMPTPASRETGKGKGATKALLFVGLGGAAAAVGGGEGTVGPVAFTDARFETPVIWCPNGSDDVPIVFGVFVNASNEGSTAVGLNLVSTVAIIEDSPAIPGEVGFSSNRPSLATPPSIPAKGRITLRVESTIVCDNTAEDGGRFNEWSARITFTTSAGVFNVATVDRMRINIP